MKLQVHNLLKMARRTILACLVLLGIANYAVAQTTPSFTGSTTFTGCSAGTAVSINANLAITDAASSGSATETWTVTSAPSHGTLGGFPYSTSSTGGAVTPSGLTYSPTSGYTGADAFTIRVSNGINTASRTVNVTVAASPNPGVITAITAPNFDSLCATAVVQYRARGGAIGGVWSSSAATTIATVSNIGDTTTNVTGIYSATTMPLGATAVITYTSSTVSCGTTSASKNVYIRPFSDTGILSPASGTTLCAGATTTFTSTSVTDGLPRYGGVRYSHTWTTQNSSIASVNSSTGLVTGVSAGTVFISYTTAPNGCGSFRARRSITIQASSTPGTISGGSSVCHGATIGLTSSGTSGGTWTSSAPSVASVSSTGTVLGVSAGSATISYSVSGSCGSGTATQAFTVNPLPNAGTISGASTVFGGATTTLSSSGSGGTWRSSATSIATVGSSTGVVFGVSGGSATISYSVTNGCGTDVATHSMSVSTSRPPTFPVGSPSYKDVCKDQVANIEANLAVRDVDAGQTLTWSMLSAPRHGTAIVAGTATSTGGTVRPTGKTYTPTTGYTGRDTFTVRVTDGTYTADLVMYMTVNTPPATPSIGGVTPICLNDSISLSATPTGGLFNSGGGGILCRPSGVVKGLNIGVYTVTYTTAPNSFGCKSKSTAAISVKTRLNPNSITGTDIVCAGASIMLRHDTTGGTWALSNSNATFTPTTGGVSVSGIAAGRDTLTYTYTNMCGTGVATRWITINPAPNAGSITGPDTVMMGGYINLSRTTASAGTWSSSDNTIASVSAAGRVRGNSTGVDTIRYSVTNSCGTAVARKTITVYSMGGKAAGEATGTAIATTSIKVWPNPSEGTINLELPEAGATIVVLDAAGKTVHTATTTEAHASINLSELPGGTYLLRVLCGGSVYAERVVIE